MMMRLKKDSKKGFTLVELIVVLVILAILAALLIPALTGYIEKAKDKNIIAETRQAVMATQTIIDEKLVTNTPADITALQTADITAIETLAEVGTGTVQEIYYDADTGKVTGLKYVSDSKTCFYNGEEYLMDPATDPAPDGVQVFKKS